MPFTIEHGNVAPLLPFLARYLPRIIWYESNASFSATSSKTQPEPTEKLQQQHFNSISISININIR